MRNRIRERLQLLVEDLKLRGVSFGFVQCRLFGLGALALGDVAGNLAEAAELTLGAVHRGDYDVGQKPGTVLAHPPSFVLESTVLPRYFQPTGRLARFDILGLIKAGEMLTDDLGGAVARDSLRTLVPAHDPALGVEHQDRVVLDSLNQPPKLFLTLQLALGGAS